MRRLIGFVLIGAASLFTIPANAQYDPQKDGWAFKNFNTPTLPWDVYRDTFIGVWPSQDAVAAPLDVFFYSSVYSGVAKTGNCFGMSLLSLMMLQKGGHLGFCLPVNQYSGDLSTNPTGPSDTRLTRAINIMHGHQVNYPTVQFDLDVFGKHKNRDAAYAFSSLQDAQARNDFTLVSITKNLDPTAHGHTLVAYRAEDLGGGNKKIWVYDSDRSWGETLCQPFYTNGLNYIKITGNAWSYDKTTKGDPLCAITETWSGDPGSGGNIIILPISVTGPHSRSPASLGDQIIGQITTELFLTGSSADVEQVTDDQGKRLYVPGTFEVDTNPATGMRSMVPAYPSDQATPADTATTVVYHLGRTSSTLNVSVRAAQTGYTLVASGPRGRIAVKSTGGRGTDLITLNQVGTSESRVAIENRRGASEYEVEFINAVQPRERLRIFRSSHIELPENSRAEFAVDARGNALSVNSPNERILYDLELQNVTRQRTDSLSRPRIEHEGGTVKTVQPNDWSRLDTAQVLEEIRVSGPRPNRDLSRARQ